MKKVLESGMHMVNYFNVFGVEPENGFENWEEEWLVEDGVVIAIRQKFRGTFEDSGNFKAEIFEEGE